MKYYYLFLFFIFGSIFGCSTKEKNVYLMKIEKMKSSLDSLHRLAFDSTRANAKTIVVSVRQTMEELKEVISEDTFSFSTIQKVDAYKDIEKVLEINSGNLAKVKQGIPEVQQKIADLKHDIQNGVNERQKYEEYLQFEKDKISSIEEVLTYYLSTFEECVNKYDSLHPSIIHLKDSLIQKHHD